MIAAHEADDSSMVLDSIKFTSSNTHVNDRSQQNKLPYGLLQDTTTGKFYMPTGFLWNSTMSYRGPYTRVTTQDGGGALAGTPPLRLSLATRPEMLFHDGTTWRRRDYLVDTTSQGEVQAGPPTDCVRPDQLPKGETLQIASASAETMWSSEFSWIVSHGLSRTEPLVTSAGAGSVLPADPAPQGNGELKLVSEGIDARYLGNLRNELNRPVRFGEGTFAATFYCGSITTNANGVDRVCRPSDGPACLSCQKLLESEKCKAFGCARLDPPFPPGSKPSFKVRFKVPQGSGTCALGVMCGGSFFFGVDSRDNIWRANANMGLILM
jgi:hypothetical protein